MSITKARAAYDDCFEVLDQALASENGTRVQLETPMKANAFRARLHYARKLDRDASKTRVASDSPDYGLSDYDGLVVTIDDCWVYIKPLSRPLVVEDL